MVYPALLPLMRTPRLPVLDWTDAPTDLNAVGSQYPSHYLRTWCIQHYYRWCVHLGCQQSTELTPSGRFKWTRPFRTKDEIWFLRVCHHISHTVYLEHVSAWVCNWISHFNCRICNVQLRRCGYSIDIFQGFPRFRCAPYSLSSREGGLTTRAEGTW